MSIGELAKGSGLAPSAIRFYESRGLLRSERSEGGQRRFEPGALLALRQLRFAQSAGFTLEEITQLLGPLQSDEPLFAQWQAMAREKLTELNSVIEQAQEMKQRLTYALECRCKSAEECPLLAD